MLQMFALLFYKYILLFGKNEELFNFFFIYTYNESKGIA